MSKRILLCDDELHILRAAEFKFKRAGYEVQCAFDGEEAWEQIEQQCPDILVTDCQMPRLDGIELVKRLRSNSRTAKLPIIMLTAKGFELCRKHLQEEHGIAAVLAKPFSPRQLLKEVDLLLEASQPEPQEASVAE